MVLHENVGPLLQWCHSTSQAVLTVVMSGAEQEKIGKTTKITEQALTFLPVSLSTTVTGSPCLLVFSESPSRLEFYTSKRKILLQLNTSKIIL